MDYTSSVTDIDEVTKKVVISIAAETVDKQLKDEFSKVAQNVNIRGFRKGKAPKQMVEKLHGGRVRLEVAHRLITSSLHEALKEKEIHSVGEPEIDYDQPVEGKTFEYTANVSLFPTPEISNYDKISVEIEPSEVTDEDVEGVVNNLLESQATLKKVESREVAEKGDVIDAILTVNLEGEESGAPEPLVVGLGEGRLPEELEEGLVGIKVGETREIEGKIPEDHKDEALKGRGAVYKVELKGISEKILPELNDDFVKNSGQGVETVLELRLKVRENLEKESENEEKAAAQAKILDGILEKNEFQVPQVLVDDEIRHMLVRFGVVDSKKTDISQISVEPFRDGLGEEAIKRVRTAVIVDRVAEQEKLTATEDDINKALEEMAEKNGIPVEEVRQFFANSERALTFTVEQTRNKTLEFLVEKATIKKVKAKKEKAEKKEKKEAAEK